MATIPPLTPMEARELLRVYATDPKSRPLVLALAELAGLTTAPSEAAPQLHVVTVAAPPKEKAAPKAKPAPTPDADLSPLIQRVKAAVAKEFGVPLSDFHDLKKKGFAANARTVANYLLLDLSSLKPYALGRAVGLSGSLVLQGVNRLRERLKQDKALRQRVEKLRGELGAAQKEAAE